MNGFFGGLLAFVTGLSIYVSDTHFDYSRYSDVSVSTTLILSNEYDYEFKKYWELWNPHTMIPDQWKLLKSQCYAESGFNTKAVSPVGAKGICQFMPATWNENGFGKNVFDADANINSASYYMMKMRSNWKSERPESDRMKLAGASYNAGFGNLLKAQNRCGGVLLYDDIVKCLYLVTGYHHKETITYVKRIWKGYLILLGE
jgi:membrane-bound lytic murein transglycosylase F